VRIEKILIDNMQGEKLAARLTLPTSAEPFAFAVFAHCFTCGKSLSAVVNISHAMAERQIGVLRFDFTGIGESEGDFAETSFSSNVEDLVAAAQFLRVNFADPKLLIGHSLGGSAVLQAASHLPAVRAVATIAAPFEPLHLARYLEPARDTIDIDGEAVVSLQGKTLRIRKAFLDDLERTRMEEILPDLKSALLICHSPADTVVDIEEALRLFRTARYPKSFVSLDGMDHLLSRRVDSLYVGSLIAAWAWKYIAAPF
jgi:alpha/beta superfamily hydrolase